MSMIEGSTPLRTPPLTEDARLRQSSRDLEGAFVEQLFKAMRETVPENTLFSGGAGEEMFTSMMDSHLASQVPDGWNDGLGEALYRQLRAALGGAVPEDASPAQPAAEDLLELDPKVGGPQ
jgi:peptidoglycan hydrolase FlgJ